MTTRHRHDWTGPMRHPVTGERLAVCRGCGEERRGTRLTDAERRHRSVTESELQAQVTDLLELRGYGWWCHFRALRNRRGIWQVPVEGPLGVGWPDLFAVNQERGEAVALELKRETARPTPAQSVVLTALEQAGIRSRVVRPSDLADPIQDSDFWRWLR